VLEGSPNGYGPVMKVQDVGHAALSGWKEKVADSVAERAPVRNDYVRAAFGLLFLALSVKYLVTTARQLAARR
jgi:hypothetical protein